VGLAVNNHKFLLANDLAVNNHNLLGGGRLWWWEVEGEFGREGVGVRGRECGRERIK
jgi:hypothetical protein